MTPITPKMTSAVPSTSCRAIVAPVRKCAKLRRQGGWSVADAHHVEDQ